MDTEFIVRVANEAPHRASGGVLSFYMKEFDKWLEKKKAMNDLGHRPPFVSEGDVWWIGVGENVGSEIGGKSAKFSRPGIIYKKLAHGFYLIIPTTTKQREGSWYVKIRQQGIDVSVCLHQVRTIDHRRLYTKIGSLDDADRARIREGFIRLYI